MSKNTISIRKQIFWALGASLSVVAVLGVFKFFQIKNAIAQNKFTPPPEAVTSFVTETLTWQQTMSATGSVVSEKGAVLSVEEPGTVSRILFESGQNVTQGQLLVELDTTVEEAKLRGSEAQLSEAQRAYTRAKTLREAKANAQADLDDAETKSKQAAADVDSLRATIARKRVVAPFAGRAGIRLVNIGQYVSPGTQIVPLHSLNPVYVHFALPQQSVRELRVGQNVALQVDAFPEEKFSGNITAIDSTVDANMRTVMVQATFPNPDEHLRPGMYAGVSIAFANTESVIAIPASSISYAPYGDTVYVIEEMKGPDGTAYQGVRQQIVKLGKKRGDQVAVLTGLHVGEQIVSSGTFKLRPGAAVVVQNDFAPENSESPRPPDT